MQSNECCPAGTKPHASDVPSLVLILATAVAVSLALALLGWARFVNIIDAVKPFLIQAANPELFGLDLNVSKSVVPMSSLVFPILYAHKIDLTSPEVVIGAHIITSLGAGSALWLLLTRVYQVKDAHWILLLMLAAAFADNKIFSIHKLDWLNNHSTSFTGAALALRMWFLYFALSGRNVAMCAVLLPLNLLTFKVGWVPSLAAGLMVLAAALRRLDRSSVFACLAWAVALAPVAWLALVQPVKIAPDDLAFVFDTVNAAFSSEDNPFVAGKSTFALLALGTLALCCGWIEVPNPRARPAIVAIILVSVAVFLAGGLYLTIGHRLWPLPQIVWLSPRRGVETLCLLIYLSAIATVATRPGLSVWERGLLLAALALYRAEDQLLSRIAIVSGLLALTALLVRTARRRWPGYEQFWDGRWSRMIFSALVLPLVLTLQGLRMAEGLQHYRYSRELGLVSLDAPVEFLAEIRRETRDSRYLFITKRQAPWQQHPHWINQTDWNYVTRKSGGPATVYYLVDKDAILAVQRLGELRETIVGAVDQNRAVSDEEMRASRDAGLEVVMPQSQQSMFPGWSVRRSSQGWVALVP